MSVLLKEKLRHLETTVERIKEQDRLRHEGDMENLYNHLQSAERKLEEKRVLLLEARREQARLIQEIQQLQARSVVLCNSGHTKDEVHSLLDRAMSIQTQLHECMNRLSVFLDGLEVELEEEEKEHA